jgi:hypothetical protein
MTRKLKKLGAALFAIFVMSAVFASVASATNDLFHSELSETTLTGEQVTKNRFTLSGQAVECATAQFHAIMTGKEVSEVTGIVPTYESCTYAGGEAIVTMNGCTYTLTGATDANGDATAKIACPAGKHIEITSKAVACIITVKEKGSANGTQTAEEGVHYTNDGTGSTRGLLIDLTAKVKVTSDSDPGEGVTCSTLTNATGTLDGTITITGEEDVRDHVGVWTE